MKGMKMGQEVYLEDVMEMVRFLATRAGLSLETIMVAIERLNYDVSHSEVRELYLSILRGE